MDGSLLNNNKYTTSNLRSIHKGVSQGSLVGSNTRLIYKQQD